VLGWVSLFRHPRRPEVGLLPGGDVPLCVRAEASIKVLIVAEALTIGWLKTESFPLSKSHATHHRRCYRRPSNPRRHHHRRRHRRCRYLRLFRYLTTRPLSGAIIPQEHPQPPPLVAPNSAHFHRSNHCSPSLFLPEPQFSIESNMSQQQNDIQERIAAARREAEQLKEKIRAKRESSADTSRSYYPSSVVRPTS
jgi:hypothetical protein